MQSITYLNVSLSRIHPGWIPTLERPDIRARLTEIDHLLQQRVHQGRATYPARENVFHALNYQPPANINVVIIGQDPYHDVNQAMGLAFSVPSTVVIPPSLRNIYKELSADLGINIPYSGDLTPWARQRLLLLNNVLTVDAHQAGSHEKWGWQVVTDAIIDAVNRESSHCVFLLWGNGAQRKGARIDTARHKLLAAAHPSPLSAHRGFFGCRHFSQVNTWLIEQGQPPIEWDPIPRNIRLSQETD